MANLNTKYVTEEQYLYAKVLEKGMYAGLLILLITFVIYATGLITPYIPLDKIADYWSMSSTKYLHDAGIPDGWGWVAYLNYSDFLNFLGIALLAAVTLISYAAIIPTLIKNNDKVYAILAALEVFILAAAASGLIRVGH